MQADLGWSLLSVRREQARLILMFYRCQYQRTNSGTEQAKKHKRQELLHFFTARGGTGTVVHRLEATQILPEL